MISYFSQYLSDMRWFIYSRGWVPEVQNIRETQMALGNGYVGSRAVLEEIPKGVCPGTFFAGVYDKIAAQVTEIVNAPNPIDLRIITEGEKLDVTAMDVHSHERVLDMKHGLLTRRTIFSNAHKKKFDYQSLRFFSMHNKHVAVMQVYLTPLDKDAHFTIETEVDTSITNKGVLTEGDKKHIHINEVKKIDDINYLCTKTLEKQIHIAYASQVQVQILRRSKVKNLPYRTFYRKVKKGDTLCITKYFAFYTSREVNPRFIRSKTVNTLRRVVKKGFDKLIKEHCHAWDKKWITANVKIEGDSDSERAIHFNIYHLLISGNEDYDNVSIGARGLVGEGYRGHVFWDTEIFVLPFFIYTNPEIARNLLMYRYHRLDAARAIAEAKGYRGAMFPWESADSGEECTPSWHKNYDGNIIKIATMDQEQHITADIAYAVYLYFQATGDIQFMLRYGLEILLETARFWASRVKYNKIKKRYEIKHVIGPDEFHENVNNNAFTNTMVQWNLLTAETILRSFRKQRPKQVNRLMKKINLHLNEAEAWKRIAREIFIPENKKTGIIESFEGYFRRKKLPLPDLDEYSLPVFPNNVPLSDLGKTQFIKQADVVMLLHLLRDNFDPEQRKANYLYYFDRTLHKSSLSPSVCAIVGAQVGETYKAFRCFMAAAYTDLKDAYGNAGDGIHAASAGGTWQVVMNGFAGMHICKGILSFTPNLPRRWGKVKFPLKWQGHNLSVIVDKENIQILFKSKHKKDWLPIRINNTLQKVSANQKAIFNIKA